MRYFFIILLFNLASYSELYSATRYVAYSQDNENYLIRVANKPEFPSLKDKVAYFLLKNFDASDIFDPDKSDDEFIKNNSLKLFLVRDLLVGCYFYKNYYKNFKVYFDRNLKIDLRLGSKLSDSSLLLLKENQLFIKKGNHTKFLIEHSTRILSGLELPNKGIVTAAGKEIKICKNINGSYKIINDFTLSSYVKVLKISDNGNVYAGCSDGKLLVFSCKNESYYLSHTIDTCFRSISSLFVFDDESIIIGSCDRKVKTWKFVNDKFICKNEFLVSDRICALALMRNGDIAVSCVDSTIKFYRLKGDNYEYYSSFELGDMSHSLLELKNGDILVGASSLYLLRYSVKKRYYKLLKKFSFFLPPSNAYTLHPYHAFIYDIKELSCGDIRLNLYTNLVTLKMPVNLNDQEFKLNIYNLIKKIKVSNLSSRYYL